LCEGPIDPAKRRDAKYCSTRCQVAAWKKANRLT
jgi:hypothetical protein